MGHGLADTEMTEYDAILDVDLRGVVHGTKHGIKAMQATGGGTILNWSSLAGLNATLKTGVYAGAKAAVIAVTKAAAAEYGHAGIRANAICPGIILSRSIEELGKAVTPAMRSAIEEQSAKPALGRAGRAEEVADLAVFLASDKATYITGAVITIDGGWSCKLP
jgi:NAD(P)-dependent dehydrogenase (short-subunit alcohol dehydrogenase family)